MFSNFHRNVCPFFLCNLPQIPFVIDVSLSYFRILADVSDVQLNLSTDFLRAIEVHSPFDPKTNFLAVWMYVVDRYLVETRCKTIHFICNLYYGINIRCPYHDVFTILNCWFLVLKIESHSNWPPYILLTNSSKQFILEHGVVQWMNWLNSCETLWEIQIFIIWKKKSANFLLNCFDLHLIF